MKKLLILASMMFVFGGCSDSVGGNGDGPDDGKVSVAFALPGIGIESSVGGGSTASLGTRTGAAVPLAENVTVRVVAYERKGTLAELSSDEYIDEATYIAVKEGDAIVLKPCSVSFDASTGRISAVSTSAASPLRLMAGTYDFYAITPALQLERDGSGKKPVAPAHASVFHGDDFASSLTENVEVLSSGSVRQPDPAAPGSTKTLTDGKVELSVLDRKCSMIEFNVVRNTATAFDKLEIVSVQLKKMTKSPVALATMLDDIYDGSASDGGAYVTDNSEDFDFPASAFTKNPDAETGMDADYPYKWRVASPMLPKKKDTYGIALKVRFDADAGVTGTTETLLETTSNQLGQLAFLPGLRYSFALKLKGNGPVEDDEIHLVLIIGGWNLPDPWDDAAGLGGFLGTTIDVGYWSGLIDWDGPTTIGGFLPSSVSSSDTWTANPDWTADLGAYLAGLLKDSDKWNLTDKQIEALGGYLAGLADGSGDWNSSDHSSDIGGGLDGSTDGSTWNHVDDPNLELGDK